MNFSLTPAAVVLGAMIAILPRAEAGEGGSSHYFPGSYGDFLVAKWPTNKSVIVRNDLFLFDGDADAIGMNSVATADADQEIWLNLLKVGYYSDAEIFGARYGAALVLPYTFGMEVDALVSTPLGDMDMSSDIDGWCDPYLVPVRLNWSQDRHNTTFDLGVFAPWGDYDAERSVNLGRNYWSVNPTVSYTYLDQDLGWEFSTTVGMTWNMENPETNYTSGAEFQLDWLAGRHISPTTAIALNGYWFEQITDDEGDPGAVPANGFRGRSVGIGPAIMKSFTVGDTPVSVIGKWLYDVEAKNRVKGNTVMISAVAAF